VVVPTNETEKDTIDMADGLKKILDTHAKVIESGYTCESGQNFRSYAVTNLRGGVGKSSIAFNLAFEISRKHPTLITDVCPQCNTTEMLLGDCRPKVTIHSALQPVILGPAFGSAPEDLSYNVAQHCDDFKGGKGAYVIAGDPELFAFPSTLYQQLNMAYAQQNKVAVQRLLHGLKGVLENEAARVKATRILMDTSPFYAGATHLAWCAADALIVPVRVDEHSIESLGLLFRQLSDVGRDFRAWNERAGGLQTPKVAAVVMTMVGSKSQKKSTPDQASRMYIERALERAMEYHTLFAHDDPSDAFVLTDDFHSAGRISGAKRIPIAELKKRSFHTVENRRLQVNSSVTRYQNELKYLASLI
jgi:chromosome partitioning protein